MRRGAHRRERIEERLEDAGLAQAIEAFPHAVPMAEALRQSAPANVLDGEEMKRLEEAAIVLGLPAAPQQAGAKHRKRAPPIVLIRPCRHRLRPLIRSESYESCLVQPRNHKKHHLSKFRRHGLVASCFSTPANKSMSRDFWSVVESNWNHRRSGTNGRIADHLSMSPGARSESSRHIRFEKNGNAPGKTDLSSVRVST